MNHFKETKNKLEKLRGIYFQIGLILAGGLALLAFEWTTSVHITKLGGVIVDEIEEDYVFDKNFEIIEEKIEKEVIKKPKVDLSKIEIVPDEHKEKETEKKEEKKEKELTFNEGDWKVAEKIKEDDTPKSFAQHMPHYEDCKNMEEEERKLCTQEKMYEHFGKKIRIPETVKMKGKAMYLAFVYFEVNKKGKVANVKILNDEDHEIPKELERQAYDAVSSLPQFIPAKNHGKKVNVLYRVPIKFMVK